MKIAYIAQKINLNQVMDISVLVTISNRVNTCIQQNQ